MANNAQNVNVGKPNTGGAIHVAPYGTALPTNAADELNDAFEDLGYMSDDGLVNDNAPETTDIKAWGGDTVYTTQTGKDDTFNFTMLEAVNPSVLKVVYGEENVKVASDGSITIEANSSERDNFAWVIDMIMRNNVPRRIVIPSAKMSDLSSITYKDDTAIGYGVTIKANPDESGNTHYEYIQASAATPTSVKTTSAKKTSGD